MTDNKNKELKNFVDNVCSSSHLRVESDLGDGYFRLRATEAQRRQAKQDIRCSEDVIVEMLRNSRDAGAKNIYVATNTENSYRNILIIDDGQGIPKTHYKLIFEPYVTSKLDTMTHDSWGVHGRGMALYSISENCEEAKVLNSDIGLGSSIYVKINLNNLNEKRDQSSFPDFYINENAELLIRGPKNIIRTICEFSVENRDKVNVFFGSFAEIASTLYYRKSNINNIESIFKNPDNHTKFVDLLGYSCDVHDFKEFASSIGIDLSKRTARRIMDNEILPQKNILEKISEKGIQNKSSNIDIDIKNKNKEIYSIFDIKSIRNTTKKKKSFKLDETDKLLLIDQVKLCFENIADKYYLKNEIKPYIKIKNNKVTISFDVQENE